MPTISIAITVAPAPMPAFAPIESVSAGPTVGVLDEAVLDVELDAVMVDMFWGTIILRLTEYR